MAEDDSKILADLAAHGILKLSAAEDEIKVLRAEVERLRKQWSEFREWLAEQGEQAFEASEEHERDGNLEASIRWGVRGRAWNAAVMEADRRMEAKQEDNAND